MQLLYGTGNQAKLMAMRRRLEGCNVTVLGAGEMNLKLPEVTEDGKTPLENAEKKAQTYYKAFGIPVFSCDSGLYFDGLPEELQPGVHVRRVNGKYLNDEEMLAYYSGLAEKYGNLTARYRNAICLILGDGQKYESMDESLSSEPFLLTSKPHKLRQEGFPLDSLSLDMETGKYYYDLEGGELDEVAVEEGFLAFFREIERVVSENSNLNVTTAIPEQNFEPERAPNYDNFKEIPSSPQWQKIEKINKGWSSDIKYYIETKNGRKLLLRVSPTEKFEEKKKEFDIIGKYAGLGFPMSSPVDFGTFDEQKKVYMLLDWVEGEDLETALPKMSVRKQYECGREAGWILRQIHSITVPKEELPQETKEAKKRHQLESYQLSILRIPGDEKIIDFAEQNLHKIWSEPPVYQHGDFHPGNLILTPEGKVGVIDFNRWEIGDPYEEFYKLESFGTEVSVPYCIGQINAYFGDAVPERFWEVLAVYVAHASLFSIKWAEKFGRNEIDGMIERYHRALLEYDSFDRIIPDWYQTGF